MWKLRVKMKTVVIIYIITIYYCIHVSLELLGFNRPFIFLSLILSQLVHICLLL